MEKINSIKEIEHIIVKVAYINVKNELTKLGKHTIKLCKKGVLSIQEQASLLKKIKDKCLPKKYICFCVLENKISTEFLNVFDFDTIDMSLDELELFERNDKGASLISSFEHKQLKPIYFSAGPLLLSDLNEIVVVLREVSNNQIRTRKKSLLSKVHNSTRRHKHSK